MEPTQEEIKQAFMDIMDTITVGELIATTGMQFNRAMAIQAIYYKLCIKKLP